MLSLDMNARPQALLRSLVGVIFLLLPALAQQPAAAPQPSATPTETLSHPNERTPRAPGPPDLPAEDAPAAARYQEVPALPPTSDPKEIIRRAVAADDRSTKLERYYTYQNRQVTKRLDKKGGEKSEEIMTYDITVYYGEQYSRLIQKNDKPLTEKEQKKEDEKLNKFLEKRKNESEEDRRKRLAREEKDREQAKAFTKDVMNAYDFRLLADEKVDGRDVYLIEAIPRKEFRPTQPHADMLAKLQGKIWIDKNDYGVAKLEVEAIDTISFGWFLARLHKGAHFNLEQTRINNEVWLPKSFAVTASARLLLLKNEAFAAEGTFSNYKKFSTSVRILPGVKEVEEPPEKKE
jgi:hypothetical protein